jgi:hypothetical protein
MNIGATSENPSFQKETVGIEACKATLIEISPTSYGRSISSGQDGQPSGGRHNRVWSRKKQPQNNRIALQVGPCGYDPAVLLIELWLRQKDLPLEKSTELPWLGMAV